MPRVDFGEWWTTISYGRNNNIGQHDIHTKMVRFRRENTSLGNVKIMFVICVYVPHFSDCAHTHVCVCGVWVIYGLLVSRMNFPNSILNSSMAYFLALLHLISLWYAGTRTRIRKYTLHTHISCAQRRPKKNRTARKLTPENPHSVFLIKTQTHHFSLTKMPNNLNWLLTFGCYVPGSRVYFAVNRYRFTFVVVFAWHAISRTKWLCLQRAIITANCMASDFSFTQKLEPHFTIYVCDERNAPFVYLKLDFHPPLKTNESFSRLSSGIITLNRWNWFDSRDCGLWSEAQKLSLGWKTCLLNM